MTSVGFLHLSTCQILKQTICKSSKIKCCGWACGGGDVSWQGELQLFQGISKGDVETSSDAVLGGVEIMELMSAGGFGSSDTSLDRRV